MIFQTGMNYAFCTLLMLKSVHFPMHKDTVRVKTKRTPIEVLTTIKDVAFNTLIYRLFFLTSITQLFSQIYTNCFASS